MGNQKKLAEFWNNEVPSKYKHYLGSQFDEKISSYLETININLLDRIDFSDINIALDWGCGGGIFSNILADKCGVVILDIAEKSIKNTEKNLRENKKRCIAKYQLDEFDRLDIQEDIDLLFSVSVIQHFPSYDYWKELVKKWLELQPNIIAIQSRHGDENEWCEAEYFDNEKNYILGLRLTTYEIISSFIKEYDLTHHKLDDDGYSMYEYFLFRRK